MIYHSNTLVFMLIFTGRHNQLERIYEAVKENALLNKIKTYLNQ